MELTIRLSNGTRFPVLFDEINAASITVLQVKQAIAQHGEHGVAAEQQRLIYKGRILEDSQTLQHYEILDKSTLFLVKSSVAVSASTAGATNRSTESLSASASTSAAFSSVNGSTGNADWVAQLLQHQRGQQQHGEQASGVGNMGSMSGMGGGFGSPLGDGMSADPQQMERMMNSPLMQGLFDNPELLQQIMQAQIRDNPALQRMMAENPHVRETLQDPASLRQMVQWMRDPQARALAQRHQDLALSQLENIPGGFAALSSLYRNVQEPLEESLVGGAERQSSSTASTRSAGDEGATGAAMPNPWATSSTPAPTPPSSASSQRAITLDNRSQFSFPPPTSSLLGSSMPNPNPWAATSTNQQQQQRQMALQMLDNPMVQQMMQQTIQENPDAIRSMLEQQDPLFRQMFQNDPQAANRMIQSMMQPDTMRAMLQLQESMGTSNFMMPPAPGANPSSIPLPPQGGIDFSRLLGSATAQQHQQSLQASPLTGNESTMDFASLMQSLQASSTGSAMMGTGAPPAPTQTPAERYRRQLASLYDMGFDDEQANLVALQATGASPDDEDIEAPPKDSKDKKDD